MSGVKGRSGGRNRLPTAIKDATGTLRASRVNPNEPAPPVGLPPAPAWLSAKARRIYRQLAALVDVQRVGTLVDGEALALAAVAREQYEAADEILQREGVSLTRTTQAGMSQYRHPACTERADAWRRYRDGLRSFGLDPQARATVRAAPPDPANNAARYFS